MVKKAPNFKTLNQICIHCGKSYDKMCRSCNKRKNFSSSEKFAMFVKSSNLVHDNKYSYKYKSDFKSTSDILDIECPIHGMFKQEASAHLKGFECELCGYDRRTANISKTTEQFISDAKLRHGDVYDYSKSVYINNQTKVEIICKSHGPFWQIPANHTRGSRTAGCPRCFAWARSKAGDEWLDKIDERLDTKLIREFKIPGTNNSVDGYDERTKICYEFLGDFYHGNFAIYKPESVNKLVKKTHMQLNEETFARFNKIKSLGYRIVYRWEKDPAEYEYDKFSPRLESNFNPGVIEGPGGIFDPYDKKIYRLPTELGAKQVANQDHSWNIWMTDD